MQCWLQSTVWLEVKRVKEMTFFLQMMYASKPRACKEIAWTSKKTTQNIFGCMLKIADVKVNSKIEIVWIIMKTVDLLIFTEKNP